jgi:hypothetical protein
MIQVKPGWKVLKRPPPAYKSSEKSDCLMIFLKLFLQNYWSGMPKGLRLKSLLNYVANQHVDHSAVSILSGVGLTGGRAIISQTATGVRVILGKRSGPQIGRMDEGNLRHPTYGHKPWVAQAIPAGTFTAALEKRVPDMRDAVAREVQSMMGEPG